MSGGTGPREVRRMTAAARALGPVSGDALPSYASGPSALPLLGDTIGANLRRTAARVPGGEALVDVPSGRRWTYAELAADVDRLAPPLLGGGGRAGGRV